MTISQSDICALCPTFVHPERSGHFISSICFVSLCVPQHAVGPPASPSLTLFYVCGRESILWSTLVQCFLLLFVSFVGLRLCPMCARCSRPGVHFCQLYVLCNGLQCGTPPTISKNFLFQRPNLSKFMMHVQTLCVNLFPVCWTLHAYLH